MKYDVIIAGGGPVGLFLATELGLRGVSVLVLEKAESAHTPLKAGWMGVRGVNETSFAAFTRRGLRNAVFEAALARDEGDATDASKDGVKRDVRPRSAGHFAAISIDGNKLSPEPDPYATRTASVAISIEALETVLEQRAKTLGVAIHRGFTVTDIQQDEVGVVVDAAGRTFRAAWLIGCDGGRSTVRKQAGFAFEGTDAQFTGYLASTDIVDPAKIKPGFNLTPFGMYAMGPGPARITVMDFDGGAFDRNQDVTLDHLQSVLRRVSNTDVTLSALHFASTFTDRAIQATTYRKGRVLLAGDAAHIHAPLGAQGLNTGLIDAMNLGWKLAATVKGTAPDALLDSYMDERHPVGAWALSWTRAQVAVMRPDPWGHAIADIARDLIATSDGATYFANKVSGSGRRYDLPGSHPLIGRSSPEFTFTDGSRLEELLQDGSAVLLFLSGGKNWPKLGDGYSDRLKVVQAEATNAKGIAALFIRPDGIVAWAQNGGESFDEIALRESLRTWIGEPST